MLLLAAMTYKTIHAQSSEQQRPQVPNYQLPEVLVCENGTTIDSPEDWTEKRRPEVLNLVADHVYGRMPEIDIPATFRVTKEWEVFAGLATAREVEITFGSQSNSPTASLLLYIPSASRDPNKKSSQPAPCFLGLNFRGNHTAQPDKNISVTKSWVPKRKNRAENEQENQASERDRGSAAGRWPVEMILRSGYAVGTMYCGDVDPDFDDGFQNGIHHLFRGPNKESAGSSSDKGKAWGTIGAWAWSLSRVADYLETEPAIDSEKLAVIGHSRLGKTSLWAGATDERFKIVISNNSGCGGAAISRRRVGESVKRINTVFPHWFCDQFTEYNDRENELPIDQHSLIALMAPRAVYVASASEDQWADPVGEHESLVAASPVFELFGNEPVSAVQPAANQPVRFGRIGYHMRAGKHDITLYDWKQYIAFANEQFVSKPKSK